MAIGRCSSGKRKKNDDKYDDDDSAKRLKRLNDEDNLLKMNGEDNLSNKKEAKSCLSLRRCSTGINKQQVKWKQQQQYTSTVQIGDRVNLLKLLFPKHRDHLITYNDRHRPVQAKHLQGKFIVLHFMPLFPWSSLDYSTHKHATTILVEIYNALQPQACLEVVFIPVKLDQRGLELHNSRLEEYFELQFSFMPWTAIPFSDIKSREFLETRFPVSGRVKSEPISIVIDPTGMVLQRNAREIFRLYGARGFPFSKERIEYLIAEDLEARFCPSVSKLLASAERDYILDKNKQKVPLDTLEDKVVALYFYDEEQSDDFRINIHKAYELLAKEKNFEIVLVYVHDTFSAYEHSSEELFWQRFSEMPWLALPYKDPICKKLQRIFIYPGGVDSSWPDPRLAIIGPHGKFADRYGADIFNNYGISSFPFTRKTVAKREAENIRKLNLKLDMFCSPDTSFIKTDGSTVYAVELSQLAGKKIMLIVEHSLTIPDSAKFWRMLKTRYLQMKGTKIEFEVIHICEDQLSSSSKHVATMSGLRLPVRAGSDEYKLIFRVLRQGYGLLAFDSDGRLVRRAVCPSIKRDNMDFPFYAGSLEKDVLRELKVRFSWYY